MTAATEDYPAVLPSGENATLLWGITSQERLRRIATAQGFSFARSAELPVLVVDLDYAFDPAWLRIAAAQPGHAITRDGLPVIAHLVAGGATRPADLPSIAQETVEIENHELRKRERPFMKRLTPATVPLLERASYAGAYKGVTDVLTKYLWPEWAFWLTRLAARGGITPNQVTGIAALCCVLATVAFWHGFYWIGLAAALAMMVLDTVDGKLARCTITSSWWGNVFDHGIDLIHPPFWWYAWGVGLATYGRPLTGSRFWACMAAIVGGYVVQRLIEGAFIGLFHIHIHVWRRFDSRFRLITARRNPNMPILLAFLCIGRPDWGLIAVAVWTIVSLLVHASGCSRRWSGVCGVIESRAGSHELDRDPAGGAAAGDRSASRPPSASVGRRSFRSPARRCCRVSRVPCWHVPRSDGWSCWRRSRTRCWPATAPGWRTSRA